MFYFKCTCVSSETSLRFSFLLFMQKIGTIFFTLNEIDNFVKLISFKCSIFNK
ncbi:hypothetical protein BACPLE_02456 [Phocaeicola plebeius DSM 17135]|uniref:Uncharacterized protein n=1 Tax=Phocaeicola plebeius (strain DSM 17135 / JCM 12973 / CCUG 54634 / M2) TaxID=484018 RepID=B5D0D2_PHOPM|nr:hypothetical protein BACPLE_02456 [Phocaeicola plebeius DSM 17135]